jgi:hypothetical protein
LTIYGPDISSYQAGLDLSRLADASFVIAKASQGTYYTDADYQGWRRQSGQPGKPFLWYHFLTIENAAAQVAHTISCVGDKTLPGMLDVEPSGSSKPDLARVLAYADAAKAEGLNLRLIYLPHWYWQEIGSPDLRPLTARGLALVSSAYVSGNRDPRSLYPGDTASGWQAYGGVTPALYQYTNQATDGGYSLDYNAFHGTLAQLIALLGAAVPSTTGVIDVTPDEHNWLTNLYSGLFNGGPSCGRLVPAGQPGGSANSVFAHLDYMTALLEGLNSRPAVPAASAVDVKALAAALAPLLTAGATADEVAAAVVSHLATALAKP